MIVNLNEQQFKVLKRILSQYIATPQELKGNFADKVVKKNPPKWKGEDFVGAKWSECSAEWLDEMAGFLEWKAGKDKLLPPEQQRHSPTSGKPYWLYDEQDARYMRGWAASKTKGDYSAKAREAAKAAMPPDDTPRSVATPPPPEDDDIPF